MLRVSLLLISPLTAIIIQSANSRSKTRFPQFTMSTSAPILASIRNNWLPSLDPNRAASMASKAPRSDFEFKPVSLKEFETVFPQLVDDLAQHCKQYAPPEDALKWYKDV